MFQHSTDDPLSGPSDAGPDIAPDIVAHTGPKEVAAEGLDSRGAACVTSYRRLVAVVEGSPLTRVVIADPDSIIDV